MARFELRDLGYSMPVAATGLRAEGRIRPLLIPLTRFRTLSDMSSTDR